MKKKIYKVIDGLTFDVSDDEFARITSLQQRKALKNAVLSLLLTIGIYLAPSYWLMVTAVVLTAFFLIKALLSAVWLIIYGRIKKRYERKNENKI